MSPEFSFATPIDLKLGDPSWVDPAVMVDAGQAGEALGFDEISVFDHFLEPPAWQPSRATSAYDPIPLLSFLAAKTERIRIAGCTINLPYRNPAVLANELASIDRLSDGRLTVGFATGYLAEEYDALGLEAGTRGARSDEYLEAILALWCRESASFEGRYVRFRDATLACRPVQSPHPEIWSLGGKARALRRAIRFCDGWSPIAGSGDDADGYARLQQRLSRERPGIHVPQSLDYARMRALLEHEREGIGARSRPLRLALNVDYDPADPAAAVSAIEDRMDQGADKIGVVLRAADPDDFMRHLQRFAADVMPCFRETGK